MAIDLGHQYTGLGGNPILDRRRQILVGEVDDGFEMGEEMGQAPTPVTVEGSQFAVELAQSLPPLGLGLGSDEVGDRFRLRQIQLAVEKSAAGELSWLREPQTKAPERFYNRGQDGPAAVQMQ